MCDCMNIHSTESHAHYCVVENGMLLCYGNPNAGMSYHFGFVDLFCQEDRTPTRIVACDLRKDAELHRKKWLAENAANGHKVKASKLKVVRVQFYWKEVTRSKCKCKTGGAK